MAESYLRFRKVLVASKKQLKKLTFERFQDLLTEANNLAFHAQAFPGTAQHIDPEHRPVTVTEAHLEAFRLSTTPCFFASRLVLTDPPSLLGDNTCWGWSYGWSSDGPHPMVLQGCRTISGKCWTLSAATIINPIAPQPTSQPLPDFPDSLCVRNDR